LPEILDPRFRGDDEWALNGTNFPLSDKLLGARASGPHEKRARRPRSQEHSVLGQALSWRFETQEPGWGLQRRHKGPWEARKERAAADGLPDERGPLAALKAALDKSDAPPGGIGADPESLSAFGLFQQN
jgi:hypothetical protein